MGKRSKTGLPPGTVVFTGNRKAETIGIHYLKYDAKEALEKPSDNHQNITLAPASDGKVHWYDMRGLHDTRLIEFFGNVFNIHALVLEDIADIHQRPKFEEYDTGNFLIFRALSFNKETLKINTEQVALYFGTHFVVSFQERETDLFEPVRQRIHNGKGKIRQRGADYLTYALVDAIVDNYYLVMDEVEEAISELEEGILNHPAPGDKSKIHHIKKELLNMRKSVAPLREAISRFSKTDSEFVQDHTALFIRDVHDHIIQVMDMLETYRDILNGLQDLFMSELGFKMNQVMQLLAVISTIFIPLTFLAGIYGMNFEYMPELQWPHGYFVLLGVMTAIFIGLLAYFKYKKWM